MRVKLFPNFTHLHFITHTNLTIDKLGIMISRMLLSFEYLLH